MNLVISVCPPEMLGVLDEICRGLSVPLSVAFHAKGTAANSMLELLGMKNNEKRAAFSVCSREKTKQLIKAEREKMFIGMPGQGIIVSVPLKSIGGGKTVEYLNGKKEAAPSMPVLNPDYELIVVIANEGRTELVMDAARAAGATGGTVLHGKGTGTKSKENFFSVSIAREKEVLLIVAKSSQKKHIMQEIIKNAGAGMEANAIAFSLPVTEISGFKMTEEESKEEQAE